MGHLQVSANWGSDSSFIGATIYESLHPKSKRVILKKVDLRLRVLAIELNIKKSFKAKTDPYSGSCSTDLSLMCYFGNN